MTTALGLADAPHAWTFDELVEEGRALVRARAPGWTDHNASDPGVTLMELLAYFGEILAYRSLLVSPDARLNFLRLLGADAATCDALEQGDPADVARALRRQVLALADADVAATMADFERLARRFAAALLDAQTRLGVRAMALHDLAHAPPGVPAGPEAAGDVCVLLAPSPPLTKARMQALCARVQEDLQRCCLLTARVHVMAPEVVFIGVGGRFVLREGAARARVLAQVEAALLARFDGAWGSGAESAHGPGRVHLADVAAAIDGCADIDYVDDLVVHRLARHALAAGEEHSESEIQARLGVRPGLYATIGRDARFGGGAGRALARLRRGADGEPTAVLLHPWEQPAVHLVREGVELVGGDDDED